MARKSKRQIDQEKWIEKEVRDIFAMFSALRQSYDALPDKSGIDESLLVFDGLDGNNEFEHLQIARRLGFEAFNSHGRRLNRYQRMLQIWKRVGGKESLVTVHTLGSSEGAV